MSNALSAVNFCIKKPTCLRYVISLTFYAIYIKANIVVLLVKIGYSWINFINFIVLSGTRLSESVYLQYDDTVFKKSSYTKKDLFMARGPFLCCYVLEVRSFNIPP